MKNSFFSCLSLKRFSISRLQVFCIVMDALSACVSADYWQHFAGDIAGTLRRCQEHICRSYFFGLGGPLHGGVCAKLCYILSFFICRVQRCPYRAGGNCIHADAFGDQVSAERAGEGMNAALGERVVQNILIAEQAGNGASIHYSAAVLHIWYGSLHHVKVSIQIGLHRTIEVLLCKIFKVRYMQLESCIVDQYI